MKRNKRDKTTRAFKEGYSDAVNGYGVNNNYCPDTTRSEDYILGYEAGSKEMKDGS